jgi:hypothetical protein
MLLVCSPFIALGQNLVPNPDFECGTDECQFSDDPNMTSTYFCQWWAASRGCPDMFSTALSPSCFGGQPNNGSVQEQPGSQLPHSGKRFAGIFTYGNTTGQPADYREYIGVQLTQPLVVGSYYRATMYAACASRMAFASNNLGMCFSVGWIRDISNQALTSYQPQVLFKDIITSTQWVKVCAVFKATNPANVVVIGNFSNDLSTLAINTKGGFPGDSYFSNAFYFIDDVSVEQVSGPDNLTLTVEGNRSICEGQSASLTVQQNADILKWTTLSDTTKILSIGNILQITPQTTNTYRVLGKSCTTWAHDTITVRVNPTPTISLGSDTMLCPGDEKILNPGTGFSTYWWQDTSNASTFMVRNTGTYSVTVTNQYACPASASVSIYYLKLPSIDLGKDTLACSSFRTLRATTEKANYVWSSGSTDSIFTPSISGKYWVVVRNQCGQATDTVQFYSPKDVFCTNVVTLNNDGKNESFKVVGVGDEIKGSVTVYNRWGDTVFTEQTYKNNWPVNDNLSAGIYYYILKYPGCTPYKGWIEVMK